MSSNLMLAAQSQFFFMLVLVLILLQYKHLTPHVTNEVKFYS